MLAALENALRLTGRLMETTRVVVSGAGAAGVAVTRILLAAGIRDIAVIDRTGVLASSRGGAERLQAGARRGDRRRDRPHRHAWPT